MQKIKDIIKFFILKIKFHGKSIKFRTCDISLDAYISHKVSISRYCQVGSQVKIGEGTYLNHGVVLASGTIGRYCSIGYYAVIGPHEHPLNMKYTSPHYYLNHTNYEDIYSPPIIEDDVWIGAHAFIKQGVKISRGAVVAAGAVVVKNVPPYTIVGGVPARKIATRTRTDET